MKNCVIIGGGIIGLCSAYYLLNEGCHVTIVDQGYMDAGASHVNAGYISPSHFISLASPGVISKSMKWLLNSSSPLYVKPRLDLDFFKWSLAFKRSAIPSKVEASIPVLKHISLLGRDLYEDLKQSEDLKFHYERKGLLMCYKTEQVGEEEWEVGKRGIQEGFEVKHLSKKEVDVLEPHVNLDIKGAVYYSCDAHMTPHDFMKEMISYLKTKGVMFYKNETVKPLEVSNGVIQRVITDKQTLIADEVILAAGSWSPGITKKLGINIPLQAGKGYRIDVQKKTGISYPAILCEARVAVTPMDGFTRFAGTMELSGINHDIIPKRVEAIANAAQNYYKGLEINKEAKNAAQCGLRPCTPDGLPYIGKSSKCKNLTIATGHAMMGWSLGPATGKLVAEIILNKKTTLNVQPFSPDRRF
ncbi:NAD(P)/FAD-dependent oxidoreductase [Aestuariivivens sediminis]|uniref:NAD(P)/FAD-dependent oxidoreductase n=1 Tax=Aestuariivivens sediminis TaxID=2913557 RepID=UPI001F574370|nr:FAD-dependent oxidoreductase [Aestuariivivens sediminis]